MAIRRGQIVVSDAVVYAELEDEAILLNVETGAYFGLNAIGTAVWKLLEKGAAWEEILDELGREFEVDPTVLKADLDRFLQTLKEHELVRDVDASN